MPLTFARWCLPYKTPAAVSQQVWTPFSVVRLFNLRCLLMEPFAMFIGDGSHVFREKVRIGMQEIKCQWHATPQSTVCWISSCTISLQFTSFLLQTSTKRLFNSVGTQQIICYQSGKMCLMMAQWAETCCQIYRLIINYFMCSDWIE